MNDKKLRIKKGGNWAYLYTIDGEEDYYPFEVLIARKECKVTRTQLLGRLTSMCTGKHNNFHTTGECLTKPFKKGRPGEASLGDFDELNKLWR